MKITRTADKVLFWTEDGIKTFSQECNLFPHPRRPKGILITEVGTAQDETKSFSVNFDDLENYAGTTFAPDNRNEMIEILAKRYFNQKYTIPASRFFDTVGDGSGSKSFASDYSGELVKAVIKPQGNRSLFLKRILVFLEDTSSVDAGKYGNNITLTNGILARLETEAGVLISDLTGGLPIKTNADYAKYGHTVTDLSFGSGANYVQVAYHFEKDGFCIEIKPGTQIAFYLNDDFSGLIEHHFRAGTYYLE